MDANEWHPSCSLIKKITKGFVKWEKNCLVDPKFKFQGMNTAIPIKSSIYSKMASSVSSCECNRTTISNILEYGAFTTKMI